MYKETIGIVGGFGGFATLQFFKRVLESFNTGYERDYPRVIMDNDFTMPSRTRALLYNENIDVITHSIARSIKNLMSSGADHIVLVCGTAHWFLDGVYEILPEAKDKVLDIIDVTGEKLLKDNVRDCCVIAAEGTLKSKLFDKKLARFGIDTSSPEEDEWPMIRSFIEAVKQNKLTPDIKNQFIEFAVEKSGAKQKNTRIILGCTELSVLVDSRKYGDIFEDPMENVLSRLKQILR